LQGNKFCVELPMDLSKSSSSYEIANLKKVKA
jgi:hypothetical protein